MPGCSSTAVATATSSSATASITKAQLTGVDLTSVRDVVLGVEYSADLQA